MTELMKKAIAKIDAESEKGGSNQKRIAQYIIDDLITDDISAEKIKVIVKDPGKPARVVWISNTLENLQRTVGGRIMTEWAAKIDVENVLPEYPRPIMERADWISGKVHIE